jgi:hypothetical protein
MDRSREVEPAAAPESPPTRASDTRVSKQPGPAPPSVAAVVTPDERRGLSWPMDCKPGVTCGPISYPDVDKDGRTSDCTVVKKRGGHDSTQIKISVEQMDAGMAVLAAADGEVLWVFDGKYDRCPDRNQPDCVEPMNPRSPGDTTGYRVCTPRGPFCGYGVGSCFWCFHSGNLVVIRHHDVPGVFATRYGKLKRGSIVVAPGQRVVRGQKIAEAASAGKSTRPGLGFEVWSTGFYELGDPWAGPCSPPGQPRLWSNDPPWMPAPTDAESALPRDAPSR